MGWSFRKSFSLMPGVRINLSRSGPRISAGVRGARVSVGTDGKARLYGGVGPLRYQKTVTTGSKLASRGSLGSLIRRLFS
jgi:Protein of unknown function (DUF4236)